MVSALFQDTSPAGVTSADCMGLQCAVCLIPSQWPHHSKWELGVHVAPCIHSDIVSRVSGNGQVAAKVGFQTH